MKIYLVGGAVRDQLLGHMVTERDWVVVGATPEWMLSQGYRPVGKDFPVFLHPDTHEEYALARTERKTAPGYQGFVFHAAKEVTLEQDLKRRDLTINAMAQTMEGEIIDPYGGQEDLQNQVLRHVSSAFAEDPVRILRLARFAARFGNFTIHPQTLQLMRGMVQSGEVKALVAERVWQEWQRALVEPDPQRFFTVLADCGALPILFSALQHNESGFFALKKAADGQAITLVRFAVLLHHLSFEALNDLCQRYRVPQDYYDLASIVARYYPEYQRMLTLDAQGLLTLLEALDAFRRPKRLQLFLAACGIIDNEENAEDKTKRLEQAYQAAKQADLDAILKRGLTGKEIGKALREERAAKIRSRFSS